MKKLITATAIMSIISLAGIQAASAHGGKYSNANDYCGAYGTYDNTYTEKDAEAIEKFRVETNSTRKQIVVKRSELTGSQSRINRRQESLLLWPWPRNDG
jgi:hypothetical protein